MSISNPSHHLRDLEDFFGDPSACRQSFRLLMHLAIRLAAAGHAEAVLRIVRRSPEARLFKPLINALRLHLGEVIAEDGEVRELACTIAEQIAREADLACA